MEKGVTEGAGLRYNGQQSERDAPIGGGPARDFRVTPYPGEMGHAGEAREIRS